MFLETFDSLVTWKLYIMEAPCLVFMYYHKKFPSTQICSK